MAHNIADLFEHAVDAAPDNPALKVGDRVVTYAELEADANRLAHYLQSQGVEPGDHVAIYAKNSIEHVVAMLAIVKIRAVMINVNYRYVEGELNYLFENADVVALIHERSYAPLVAACWPKHEQLRVAVVVDAALDPDDAVRLLVVRRVLWRRPRGQSDERDFGERSPTTSTSSTPAAPPASRRASCGATRTSGACSAAASTSTPASCSRSSTQSSQANDPRMATFPLSPLMHGGAQAGLLMHLFAGHLTIVEPSSTRCAPGRSSRATRSS